MRFLAITLISLTPGPPVSSILMRSRFLRTYGPRRITGSAVQPSAASTRKAWPVGPAAPQVTLGATRSVTSTLCVAVAALPEASVAVQVTTVVPTGKLAGASLASAGVPAQSSTATGNPRLAGPQSSMETAAGTDSNKGAVVSTTVTVWVAAAARRSASSAVQVIVLAPT